MRAGIKYRDLEVGAFFSIFQAGFGTIYQKVSDSKAGYIYNNDQPTTVYPTDNMRADYTVYPLDVTITAKYAPEPEPKPKFKVGDLMKVLDKAWDNRLVGQIVRVNTYVGIKESGYYKGQFEVEVEGARPDGSVLYQYVPESSLELVCSK